ncbi:15326_t:CDS:2 [Acaulospora morrowiae]|uniref:15326_t:CDS:1 n=1 Tax=Acaulospora morrowiae TaxID=94023 RepID=A0A9N8WHA0_9GLOM|nr:15326_t:CDS:2 [Acaulospora morrowiae]
MSWYFHIQECKGKDEDPNTHSHSNSVNVQISQNTHAENLHASCVKEFQTLIEDIKSIHKDSQYNEKTCSIFLHRIEAIIQADRKRITSSPLDRDYLHSFSQLCVEFGEIRDFLRDISQLKSYYKFKSPREVKMKSLEFLSDLDKTCRGSHLDVTFSLDRRSEMAYLEEDEKTMIKFLQLIEDETENSIKSGTIFIEISIIREKIYRNERLDVSQIPATHLTHPSLRKSSDLRGKVFKRILSSSIPVACKPLASNDEISIKGQLAILSLMNTSKNIIKFHGISIYKNSRIVVHDWAEHGKLSELYKTKHLDWTSKIRLARDVCKGLVFLHACDILHQDIRCENILITEKDYYEAKITNIRGLSASGVNTMSFDSALCWMAPEKMQETRIRPVEYDFKCDVFRVVEPKRPYNTFDSFGMLLWEISFQKIPYEGMELDEVRNHVLSERRETLFFARTEIVGDFRRVIESCWKHDPKDRPWIKNVFINLSRLVDKSSRSVLQLKDGLRAHKVGEYEKAWKCFEMHAELGDLTAKVWKGYYLFEGHYVPRDQSEAVKIYKEAADAGNAEGQLRYAFFQHSQKNNQEFVKYLKMSAKNNNSKAQFFMSEIYMEGKMGVEKDENKGLHYLRLAAKNNYEKAIKALQRYS